MDIPHLVIHSSLGGCLGSFYLLAIMNNAAVTIYAQVFIRTYVFTSLGYMYMSGLAGSDVKSVIKLLRNCQTVPQAAVPFYISTSNV